MGVTSMTVHDMCEDFCARYGTNTLPPGVTVGGVMIDARVVFQNAAGLTNSTGAALGILVVDDVPATNAEIPGPLENQHADWMYYQPLLPTLVPSGVTRADVRIGASGGGMESVRVRSQRKIQEVGQALFWSIQSNNAADTMDVTVYTSTLLLLP